MEKNMRRIAPPDHKFKPYESTVRFWRDMRLLLQFDDKVKSTDFIRFYSGHTDGHSLMGGDSRPKGQEQEAVNYLYSLMNSILAYQLGESEKPQINWGDFDKHIGVLDRAVIDYGPKY